MKAFELATYWWQPSVFGMPRALTLPASISAVCMTAYLGLISGSYWEAWDEPAPKPEI